MMSVHAWGEIVFIIKAAVTARGCQQCPSCKKLFWLFCENLASVADKSCDGKSDIACPRTTLSFNTLPPPVTVTDVLFHSYKQQQKHPTKFC